MKNVILVLALAGFVAASPITKRDAPYPAALPHSTYGEPIVAPPVKFIEVKPIIKEIPTIPAEEYGPPAAPVAEYGPPQAAFIAPAAPALPTLPELPAVIIPEEPKTIEAALPVVSTFEAPISVPEEYGPPKEAFIAPAAPALPTLPELPTVVINHIPDAPKEIETPIFKAPVDAPYPAALPHSTYGEPIAAPIAFVAPKIQEALPIAENFEPLPTDFIAPAAPTLPNLPELPAVVIQHFPEAPKEIETPTFKAPVDAPYPAALPHSTYGEPIAAPIAFVAPKIQEALPIVENFEPLPTDFIAPAPPALPTLPQLPAVVIPHFPEAPKEIETPTVKAPIDAPYPAALPHSTYGEPIAAPIAFVAPKIQEALPIVENFEPIPTDFIAPAAPALPTLPQLPAVVIPHFPEAPKEIETPAFKAPIDAPYPADLPHSTYGEPIVSAPVKFTPPAILEVKPLIADIPETPAEEYGPPATSFIAPAAPALPALPHLPEVIITHIPEAPKAIQEVLAIDQRFEAPAAEYGPPVIKEAKPIIKEIPATPAEEYGPPETSFIAPAAPALPSLPELPAVIVPVEAPKAVEAILPTSHEATYPAPIPHETYGLPTTTLPPPTTTTTEPAPTGPYPAAVDSHYGDPIQKSTPFHIR